MSVFQDDNDKRYHFNQTFDTDSGRLVLRYLLELWGTYPAEDNIIRRRMAWCEGSWDRAAFLRTVGDMLMADMGKWCLANNASRLDQDMGIVFLGHENG